MTDGYFGEFEDLRDKRQSESKEIISCIQLWLLENQQKARSESGLLSAINYVINHWVGYRHPINWLESYKEV